MRVLRKVIEPCKRRNGGWSLTKRLRLVAINGWGRDWKFTVVCEGMGWGLKLWNLTLISILSSKLGSSRRRNSLQRRVSEIWRFELSLWVAR